MAKDTKVIIVVGKAQSGKSTTCDYLDKKLSCETEHCRKINTKIYSFADPLKEFCMNVFGVARNQLYGTDEEKNRPTHLKWHDLPFNGIAKIDILFKRMRGIDRISWPNDFLTGRELLQLFGTEICRHMYNDCWANATRKRIDESTIQYALIGDCRFPNELDVFKDINPIVIRLLRNPLNKQHESEIALDNYDFKQFANLVEIDNTNMSWEDKDKELDKILERIMV